MCGYGNVEAVRVILDAVDDGAIVTPKWPIPNAAPTDGPPDSHAITIGTPTSPNASVTVAALLAARNQAGHSLFHLACLHASLNVVHYLLNERLAELTASQDLFSLIQEKDGSGRNVLHLACAGPPNGSNGSPASRADCVRALINTVLASLPDERERVLRTLLTERTPESWNVMMLASLSGHAAVLSLLIEYTDAYPALQGELLNAADAQGVSLAGLALSARASKPWLRTELDQVLGLISSLESPAVSPGTPVKPPLLVAQAPRAGRPGAVEVQVQLQSGVDDGHESSPGSAVSGEERSGLSRKKHAEDRD